MRMEILVLFWLMQYPHPGDWNILSDEESSFYFSSSLLWPTGNHHQYSSITVTASPASFPALPEAAASHLVYAVSRHFHALLSHACFAICHGTFPFIILYPCSLAHVLFAAGTFQWWINNPHLLSYISHWFPWHHSPSLLNPMAFSIGSELFKECLSWGLGDSHRPGRKPWGRSKEGYNSGTILQFCQHLIARDSLCCREGFMAKMLLVQSCISS